MLNLGSALAFLEGFVLLEAVIDAWQLGGVKLGFSAVFVVWVVCLALLWLFESPCIRYWRFFRVNFGVWGKL